MGLSLEYGSGQTTLDEDEQEGLLIPAIATHGELNEFEQQNIEKAMLWTIRRSFGTDVILSEKFIMALHKRMYGDVWRWAGKFRKSAKNIGTDAWQISTALRQLIDDAKYWIKNITYLPDEMALRFKHRLVSIHCFANGNGRHSRLMADVIIEQIFRQPVFSWGSAGATNENIRAAYITAIKAADKGNFSPLIRFARS